MQISPQKTIFPYSGNDSARQKIDQALQILTQTRTDNTTLSDVFVQADESFDDYSPHIKAIEFDRPDKDVSAHGTALRQQADEVLEVLHTGGDELSSVKGKTIQMLTLIEGAKADIGSSNNQAVWRLESAFNDLIFVKKSNQPGLDRSYNATSRLLSEDLDPYLIEVEEDAPGRDVGRFADDLEEIFSGANKEVGSGPIYSRSAERSFSSAEFYLKKAKETLGRAE